MSSRKHTALTTIAMIAMIASCGALGACAVPVTLHDGVAGSVDAGSDETTGAGLYYPPASSLETPNIRFQQMLGVGPQQRQSFVDQVNLAVGIPGRSLPIVAQAVGANRETLVVLYVGGEGAMTPYLARGVLARLTAITRSAPAIQAMGLSSDFDAYNMAAVLGFARIVVTDGRAFAHQADLRQN
jgi:hypothetical protein